MIRSRLLLGMTGCLLATSLLCHAQEQGNWRAASSNAKAITGDIAFAPEKMMINFALFTIAQIRTLQPAEVSAAFNVETGASGNLYRMNLPGATKFMHKNTLCGGEDTQWMATYVSGRSLQVAFFSGASMPVFTIDALGKSTDLCGTFTYQR